MGLFGGLLKTAVPAAIGYATGGPMGALKGAGMSLVTGGLGGGGGGFGGGGGGMSNPADSARPYLNQIPGTVKPYLEPYIQGGAPAQRDAMQAYQNIYNQYNQAPDLYNNPNIDFNKSTAAYGQMANDPTQFINNIMKQYTPSEGYKYKQNQLQSAVRNSAASGGFAGTRYDQGNQAELIKGLLGEDMQQYLSNILGTQAQGLSGVERLRGGQERAQTQRLAGQDRAQGLMAANAEQRAERAYSASTELASLLAAALGEHGSLGFHGQNSINANRGARQQNQMSMFSNILGSAMTAGSGGAGGGSFLGNLFGR